MIAGSAAVSRLARFAARGARAPGSWFGGTARVVSSCALAALAVIDLLALVTSAQAETFGPGSYTYTVPPGVTRVKVRVVGGVGGAGNEFIDTGYSRGGAAHIIDAIVNVVPGDTISGTVARGGEGGFLPGDYAEGGTGVGRGGDGGGRAVITGGTFGGGGGGGTSLALNGTSILKAAGGGGGGGGAGDSNFIYRSPEHGGNASGFVSRSNCNTSGNGASAAKVNSGGSGGGGGGGYAGGVAGSGYAYNASDNGTPSTGGSSCRSNQSSLFATGPSTSSTATNSSNGRNGADGYVQILELKPSLSKSFAAGSVKKGENVALTLTITNPAGAAAQNGLSFTDTLPSGLVVAGVPAAFQCGGEVSRSADGSTIGLSGGSLAAGPSSCTVTLQVTAAASQGSASCPNPSTTNGPGNISGLSSNLANGVTDQCVSIRLTPSLTKAFGAASIKKGEATTLTFTLSNPSGSGAQTGLSFTDTLPNGLTLASAPAASQCGGTVTGSADGKTVTLSGGSLGAGPSSCTVTAQVTTATSQDPASCANPSTTNGAANITAISANLANTVTDQCLGVTPVTPVVTIAKISDGGTGTFTFKGTAANHNGFPTDGSYSLATSAPGTAVTGNPVTLAAADVPTAIEESLPPGWRLGSARCEDQNWQQTGNPRGEVIGSVADGRTLVIPAANARAGAKLVCSFTNRFVGFTLSGQVIRDDGTGGGTAHNAALDGGEAGLGGVPVRFTDCGATTYASTVTAGDGTFSLPLAGPAGGASVCVVRDPVTELAGVSGGAGNTGGTVATPGYDAVAFTYNTTTDYHSVRFGVIERPRLADDGAATVAPGGTVFLAHRYTATTAATASFSIANAIGRPALSAFTYTLFRDEDCSGTLDSGETAAAGAVSVAAGEEVCLIVRVQASAGAAGGAALEYDVTADTALSGTLASLAPLTDHDVLTVPAAGTISLVKRVRNVTSGSGFAVSSAGAPGDILEYRIAFTNPSAEAVSELSIQDETPAYTRLSGPPAAAVAPSGMSCTLTVPAAGGVSGYAGPLRWDCTGTMSPGATGNVAFQVRIAN
ncbi:MULTISPECIES: DUF11 domain-containing protein [Sinorhizobium]|uniref:DUF7933 domain-containing protein n=1 Tax=Sinorhizobium TaxID=28105 RepID=UPI000C9B21CC|nr:MULTISPECIES: DUF11 domain-containing protein [Sinorhizobium]PND22367.1 hypothetical protein CN934_05465 [Ensifer sp. MMN_5]RVQ04206.1 DUF11 domain-containing protein [Sinorhizobium meliloti]